MLSCSECRIFTSLFLATVFLILGVLGAIYWETVYFKVVRYEMSLASENTMGYKTWVDLPIPLKLEVFLFNWTNPELFIEKGSKPHFEEVGPYVFTEWHTRTNLTFNDNNTLTFETKRVWYFEADESGRSLDDKIIILNPLVAVIGKTVKSKHILVQRAVNFMMQDLGESELATTKTAEEVLFKGFHSNLLDVSKKIQIKGLTLPFSRFGWFAERNGSADFDGVYNIYTGADNYRKLALMHSWKYRTHTQYYRDECGKVKGSSGELLYPPEDDYEIEIFAPDLCSTLILYRNGTGSSNGVKGARFQSSPKIFDNGTLYPEMACFNFPDVELYSGVRNVSSCKYGAPAFASFPHFFNADPSYRDAISGMNPDAKKHQIEAVIEPTIGIPLSVRVQIQVNLLVEPVEGIDTLYNVTRTFFPVMWFRVTAELPTKFATLVSILLKMRWIGTYLGLTFALLGIVIFVLCGYLIWNNMFKKRKGSMNLTEKK